MRRGPHPVTMVGALTLAKCDSTARVLMMGQGLKVTVTNIDCHIQCRTSWD